MTETFRLRKSIKYQGMAYAAGFFAAVLVYASTFFPKEPAEHGFKGEHSVAIVGGLGLAVFGTMFLLSLYMWTACYLERFTIDGPTLSIRSMFQDRQFDVLEIQRVKWIAHPSSGSIHFTFADSTKLRLDLHGYTEEDRLRIIRAVHEIVPPQAQEEWPMFCVKVALPLRDGDAPTATSEDASELYTVTRERYDHAFMIGFPLSIAIAVSVWAWLKLWQLFALPGLLVCAWVFIRVNVPREGREERRVTSRLSQDRAILVYVGGMTGTFVLMAGLGLLGKRKTSVGWIACLGPFATFLAMLYFLYKSDKERQATDMGAEELAPTRWQEGEGIATNGPANPIGNT